MTRPISTAPAMISTPAMKLCPAGSSSIRPATCAHLRIGEAGEARHRLVPIDAQRLHLAAHVVAQKDRRQALALARRRRLIQHLLGGHQAGTGGADRQAADEHRGRDGECHGFEPT